MSPEQEDLRSLWKDREHLKSRLLSDTLKLKEIERDIEEANLLGDKETFNRLLKVKEVILEEIDNIREDLKEIEGDIRKIQLNQKDTSLLNKPDYRITPRRDIKYTSPHYTNSKTASYSNIRNMVNRLVSDIDKITNKIRLDIDSIEGQEDTTEVNLLLRDLINFKDILKKHINKLR